MCCRCYSARPAIGQYDKCSNSFKFMTFSEVWEMVTWFSGGLKKLMSSPSCGSDGTISMCSVSRLEWYITDLSCLLLGYTTVSINIQSFLVFGIISDPFVQSKIVCNTKGAVTCVCWYDYSYLTENKLRILVVYSAYYWC